MGERVGRAGAPRPGGRLVWLHGASVGETLSALPLVAALRARAPGLGILVTGGTVTAARRLAALLPAGAVHQYAPLDTRAAVVRFLDHWRPDLALWIESELWPRMVVETAARGTPMMLVNARLSEASARGWARLPGMARALLSRFARIVTQDGETARRLRALGADPARVAEGGNLKIAAPPPAHDPEALAAARAAARARPVWLAASTHEGEEAIAAAAQTALPAGERPLLVVVPRHPERGGAVAAVLARARLSVARRSAGEAPGPGTDVWLADTLGEMGLWYRLAPVAFVGGSLVARGGHNPFEPAALGAAILHGPHVANFAPAYAALAAAGGAREVTDAPALAGAVAALQADAAARARMTEAAAGVRAAMTPDLDRLAGEALALMEGRA
jgi:3-deoxy-D-manno-octulosonic-acid transferase